jgi:hypothetical protein
MTPLHYVIPVNKRHGEQENCTPTPKEIVCTVPPTPKAQSTMPR